MSNFTEKKNEIMGGSKGRKVFNVQEFNKLGTALLNDPEYTTKIASMKGGVVVNKEIQPVKELREKMIGGVLREAGLDTAEQKKFAAEYQFPTLPLHGVVSEMLSEYMDANKPFTFNRKEDMKASIYIEQMPETIKDVKSPKTGEVHRRKYSEFRRVRAKSTCPPNKKSSAE